MYHVLSLAWPRELIQPLPSLSLSLTLIPTLTLTLTSSNPNPNPLYFMRGFSPRIQMHHLPDAPPAECLPVTLQASYEDAMWAG